MIPNMADLELAEKLLKYMQQNGCKEIDTVEAKAALKNLNQSQEVCEKVSYLEGKQPMGIDSATSFSEDIALDKFVLQYIPMRCKATVLESMVEFVKRASEIPKVLKPKIEGMEFHLKMAKEKIKGTDSIIAVIAEKLKHFEARDEKTLSYTERNDLKMRRYDMEAELKKCENWCDKLEKALRALEVEFRAHLKRFKTTGYVGAAIITVAFGAISGGVAALGGAVVSLASGLSGAGTAGVVSGLFATHQISKQERTLKMTFQALEDELDKIDGLFKDKAIDVNKLAKAIDDMLKDEHSSYLFSCADAL